MNDNVKKHSGHIYDTYKLFPVVSKDVALNKLMQEECMVRAKTNICPSTQPDVNVPKLLQSLIDNQVFREDKNLITDRSLEENLSYKTVIKALKLLADGGVLNLSAVLII